MNQHIKHYIVALLVGLACGQAAYAGHGTAGVIYNMSPATISVISNPGAQLKWVVEDSWDEKVIAPFSQTKRYVEYDRNDGADASAFAQLKAECPDGTYNIYRWYIGKPSDDVPIQAPTDGIHGAQANDGESSGGRRSETSGTHSYAWGLTLEPGGNADCIQSIVPVPQSNSDHPRWYWAGWSIPGHNSDDNRPTPPYYMTFEAAPVTAKVEYVNSTDHKVMLENGDGAPLVLTSGSKYSVMYNLSSQQFTLGPYMMNGAALSLSYCGSKHFTGKQYTVLNSDCTMNKEGLGVEFAIQSADPSQLTVRSTGESGGIYSYIVNVGDYGPNTGPLSASDN